MSSFSLSISDAVDESTERAIGHGLDSFNEVQVGPDPSRPAWVVARDDDGSVIAGLKGISVWTWFMIDWLWVDESWRGQKLGSRLITAAENVARERGCLHVYLYTYSFQAPEFYRKHGYREFGRLEDFPPGHSRLYLRKDLSD